MLTRSHRATWFGLIALVGCQQPPDISGDIDTYASLVSDANSLTCNCPEILGYSTISECDDVLGVVGLNERECISTVLKGHEDAAREYLVCASAAYQGYVDCLETNVDCEESVYNDCAAEHEDAMASCPLLPADTQSAFEACVD